MPNETARELWERSFSEQIARQAYNTAPVEALVRTVAYHLRENVPAERNHELHFLELGCGAGPNLVWLAKRGIHVSGIDVAPTALELARSNLLVNGCSGQIDELIEGSVTNVPLPSGAFDGILEACVFQHLNKDDRQKAFQEVRRLLKPGGVFVGYMLDRGHTVYQKRRAQELPDDSGTLILSDGTSKLHLTDIGLSHFYSESEFAELLKGFSTVDPCLTTYYIPKSEARKRGYDSYLQSMWTVYAVK
jgi:SAM-dependent methyltransferase